jgi:outer membrane protein TolC
VYQPAQPFSSGSHLAPAVGLTLPVLYAFGGERVRARASLDAARVGADRVQLQLRADVTLAFDSYLSSRALADRYACGLIDAASRALDDARYAYERGATALPDLLEAIRAYADTRADYLTALHDYWVSLFALERASGVDFKAVGS